MATTINAATTGLVETSDGTAVLDLQTGGTTALRVNASQAIGVGSSPSFGTTGQFLTSQGNAASPTWTTGGTGTVTSVGWTGGIVSVATATTTPAFTIAGTSGGIPYFSSGTTWASSAALTQYGIVYGGGAGAAPVATAAGTTGQFLGANTGGAPTWQTPSGGGTPGGSNTYVQYNSSGSFAGSANMTFDGTTFTVASRGIAKAGMPAGSVLQVVQASTSSAVSVTNQTFTDTNLSASITPTSSTSKILVMVSQSAAGDGFATAFSVYLDNLAISLVRNSTVIVTGAIDSSGGYEMGIGTSASQTNMSVRGRYSVQYLDSPATTSATTYKTQIRNGLSGMTATAQSAGTSFITLMEIAV